ncbi:MAG: response regulator transcription factor [Planctomycetes bacterium]|nr:response regulator transcription factor [Planctomycetota bacterium]
MRVLVVEDSSEIATFVQKGLKERGFVVDLCRDGETAYAQALATPYDAILLDIMLPGRDGLSILRALRERKCAVPVILVTARSALSERVEGLNLGADDYLAKPFYVEELVARINAVTRRASGQPLSVLRAGGLAVDLLTREVKRGTEPVELTAREFSLLEVLLRAPGRVFTRTQLLERVWGYDFDPQTNVVDVYVRRLRLKIDGAAERSWIEAVRGVGYRFRHTEDP